MWGHDNEKKDILLITTWLMLDLKIILQKYDIMTFCVFIYRKTPSVTQKSISEENAFKTE